MLGGGGVVGAAYHAGALAALEQDLDWDPRDADVIVGTSAGALIGALLRLDLPSSDLAALAVGAPVLHGDRTLVRHLVQRPEVLRPGWRSFLRVPRPPNLRMIVGLAGLWARRGVSAVASLSMFLPDGPVSLAPHLTFIDTTLDAPWPEKDLFICAVAKRNGHRTVFGRDGAHASLAAAVAASCAVPGIFEQVGIDGESYVDGGVVSPTNADVLRRCDLDLVIVVSPMTGRDLPLSLAGTTRRLCRAALAREVRKLALMGIPATVIEPGPEVLRHVTLDFMSEANTVEIVRAAFLDAGAQIYASPQFDALRRIRLSAPRQTLATSMRERPPRGEWRNHD